MNHRLVVVGVAVVLLVVLLMVVPSDAASVIDRIRRRTRGKRAHIIMTKQRALSGQSTSVGTGVVTGPIQFGWECEVQFQESDTPTEEAKNERTDSAKYLLLLYRPVLYNDDAWRALPAKARVSVARATIKGQSQFTGWKDDWRKLGFAAAKITTDCEKFACSTDQTNAVLTLAGVAHARLFTEDTNRWTAEIHPQKPTADRAELKRAHDALFTLFGAVGIQLHTTFVMPPAAATPAPDWKEVKMPDPYASQVAALFARVNDYIGVYKYGHIARARPLPREKREKTKAPAKTSATPHKEEKKSVPLASGIVRVGMVTRIDNKFTGSVPQSVVDELAQRLHTGQFGSHNQHGELSSIYRRLKYNFVGFRFRLYGDPNRYGFEIRGTPGVRGVDRYSIAACIYDTLTALEHAPPTTHVSVTLPNWPPVPLNTIGRTIGRGLPTNAPYTAWFQAKLAAIAQPQCNYTPWKSGAIAGSRTIDRTTCGEVAEAMRARIEQCWLSGLVPDFDFSTAFAEAVNALTTTTVPPVLAAKSMTTLKDLLVVDQCRWLTETMETTPAVVVHRPALDLRRLQAVARAHAKNARPNLRIQTSQTDDDAAGPGVMDFGTPTASWSSSSVSPSQHISSSSTSISSSTGRWPSSSSTSSTVPLPVPTLTQPMAMAGGRQSIVHDSRRRPVPLVPTWASLSVAAPVSLPPSSYQQQHSQPPHNQPPHNQPPHSQPYGGIPPASPTSPMVDAAEAAHSAPGTPQGMGESPSPSPIFNPSSSSSTWT